MISKWLIAPFLLCGEILSTQLHAQEAQQQPPKKARGIHGIFLTSKREDIISTGRPDATGIQVMDFNVPGGAQPLIKLLEPYLGKPVKKKTVIEIKQKIMTYYVEQGNSMIGVEIPSQKTVGGVIQILVIQKRFGRPVYKGEALFNNERLGRLLSIEPGQEIAEDVLRNNLSWLNKNPFHVTDMKFVPGEEPDVINIQFTSKKRRPIRTYVKGDNTGSATTGYGRIATGFAWGNAMWRGDLLSFEYKFSNEFNRLQNYNTNYTCFLPWKHILTVYGTYAKAKPANPKSRITAISWQARARYNIPFRPLYKPFQQSLAFEFDVKHTNSSVFNLSGTEPIIQPLTNPRVNKQIYVTEFLIDYTAFNKIGKHSLNFNINVGGMPFTFLPQQSRKEYNRIRPHSKPKFVRLGITFGDVITFKSRSSISILLRTQLTPWTLPSTELYSLGGYNTVRGYHQSEIAGDNAFVANLELRSPDYKTMPKKKGRLTGLVFIDYGLCNNLYHKQSKKPGAKRIPHTEHLLGMGPGIRYNVNPTFQLRMDYGFKLHKLFSHSKSQSKLHAGSGQLHIGALASY